jgi:hypothetical protein
MGEPMSPSAIRKSGLDAPGTTFAKVEQNGGATPLYMIVADQGWRQMILCEGMYEWAADWLLTKLGKEDEDGE